MKRCLLSLLPLLTVSCVPPKNPSPQQISSRNAAPDFMLADQHGLLRSLDEFHGKVVILNFWAPWCFTCKEEMAGFKELRAYFPEENFEIVAVTVLEAGQRFSSASFPFPVLLDIDRRVASKYGVGMLPVTFILDKDGRIAPFPDPQTGVAATMFQGPKGWRSKRTVEALQRLIDE